MLAEESEARIFVLGAQDELRVSVVSQQVRAINLAAVLSETGGIRPLGDAAPTRIAVIGAGAAGTTMAAAAALLGAEVTLFDEHEEPVTTQRWSFDRFLHPNLFDWPAAGWDEERAESPVMDWSAAPSAKVRLDLIRGFARAADACQRIAWCSQHLVHKIKEYPDRVVVTVSDLRGLAVNHAQEVVWRVDGFDYAVVATGFLPESPMQGAQMSGSYWKDVDLPALAVDAVTIIGDGDGALTELLCLTVCRGRRGQKQQRDLVEIAREIPEDVRLDVIRRESQLLRGTAKSSLEIYRDDQFEAIDRVLAKRARLRQVDVLAGSTPLRPNSFPINRVLATRLTQLFPDWVRIIANDGHVGASDLHRFSGRSVISRVGSRMRTTTLLARAGSSPREVGRLMTDAGARGVGLLTRQIEGSEGRWASAFAEKELENLGPTVVDTVLAAETRVSALDGAQSMVVRKWRPRVDAYPEVDVLGVIHRLACLAVGLGQRPVVPEAGHWSNFRLARGKLCGDVREVVDLSLDVVAAASDLTPSEVVRVLCDCDAADVALVSAEIVRSAERHSRRLWVRQAMPDGTITAQCHPEPVTGPEEQDLTLLSLLLAPALSESDTLPADGGFGFLAARESKDDIGILVPLVLGRREEASRPMQTKERRTLGQDPRVRSARAEEFLTQAIGGSTRAERRLITLADQCTGSLDDQTAREGLVMLASIANARDRLSKLTSNYIADTLPLTPVEALPQLLWEAALGTLIRGVDTPLTAARPRALGKLFEALFDHAPPALDGAPDDAELDLSAFDLRWPGG